MESLLDKRKGNFLSSDLRLYFNPLMPGGKTKFTHTQTNLQLSTAGLFKYVWTLFYHQALVLVITFKREVWDKFTEFAFLKF